MNNKENRHTKYDSLSLLYDKVFFQFIEITYKMQRYDLMAELIESYSVGYNKLHAKN